MTADLGWTRETFRLCPGPAKSHMGRGPALRRGDRRPVRQRPGDRHRRADLCAGHVSERERDRPGKLHLERRSACRHRHGGDRVQHRARRDRPRRAARATQRRTWGLPPPAARSASFCCPWGRPSSPPMAGRRPSRYWRWARSSSCRWRQPSSANRRNRSPATPPESRARVSPRCSAPPGAMAVTYCSMPAFSSAASRPCSSSSTCRPISPIAAPRPCWQPR